MSKIIAHIDLNAFFASAEEIRHPELQGKPLAIGGEGRSGIISTANYAARKYGVHSAQPSFQAKACCEDLIILPPDFDYYVMMSRSFFGRIREFFPLVEMASIDEAYVDMTERLGKNKDPLGFLRRMQNYLKEETGLSCSIGIAPTKWLAKMGSDLKKPMGLTAIRRKDIEKILYPLSIDNFWGIGKKTAPVLRQLGIQTIGDLARKLEENDAATLKTLGKFASTAKDWIEGRGNDSICIEEADQKSISMSETLRKNVSSPQEGEDVLKSMVVSLSSKLQESHKVVSTITLTLKDAEFHLHSKSLTVQTPTNKEQVLYLEAWKLMGECFERLKGKEVRLIGVAFSKMEDEARQTVQMSLWNYEDYEALDKTKLLIHDLNRKSGKNQFIRAREIKEKKNGNR